MQNFVKILIIILFFSLPAIVFPFKNILAERMTSTNYIIWMDSLNQGGEETSFSTNYQLQDTLGEMGTGRIASTNYAGLIGFRQVESDPKLTFAISKNSIDFGALTVGSVFQDNYTITTTTNAVSGYQTTIYEDGNFRTVTGADIDDVADGEVTANFEEYGIRTSGAHGQMNSADTAITSTPQVVAAYSSWINSSTVTVTHKVSISLTTAAGYYEHRVTLVSTGRF